MSKTKQSFLNSWVRTNLLVYPLSLGILHPLLSHGLFGDHGVELSLPQLLMHTIAMCLFALLLAAGQNKALRILLPRLGLLDGALYLVVLAPLAFWTGYYTLYIPYDILFMLLSIGGINAVRLRPYVQQPRKWVGQSMLVYFLGAAAGIAVGMAAFFGGVKDLPGLWRDLSLWVAISTPAGAVIAYGGKAFLKKQVVEAGALPEPKRARAAAAAPL